MLEIRLKNSLFGQTMEKLELNRPVWVWRDVLYTMLIAYYKKVYFFARRKNVVRNKSS